MKRLAVKQHGDDYRGIVNKREADRERWEEIKEVSGAAGEQRVSGFPFHRRASSGGGAGWPSCGQLHAPLTRPSNLPLLNTLPSTGEPAEAGAPAGRAAG